ncbi:hypothetical protein BDZ89DRAFT_371013 [Hymenopellis radicata]|nr:hypothetical protein BDZ89DRAFT_371013 [Hymenopellis radicata]
MSTTFEDYGLTAADVQSIMSANLHPVILLVFCHGIYTCFFFVVLYYILAQSARPKRKRMASIITFLWSINTILVALEWNLIDNIFIIHGISLEDKFDFYLYGGSIPKALTMDVFSKLGTILADVILIWRCWVMYGGSLVVLAIPSLCLVTETISVSILIAVYYNPVTGASEVNWSLVYYSTTVVTNSLCTFLILFRIVRFSGVLGASFKTYRGVIRILVESAAMYAIIYIALLVAYAYEFYASQTVVMTAASYLQAVSVRWHHGHCTNLHHRPRYGRALASKRFMDPAFSPSPAYSDALHRGVLEVRQRAQSQYRHGPDHSGQRC